MGGGALLRCAMSVKNTILPELTESDIRDFLSNVNRESGQGPHGRCWEWKGSKTVDTYGRFHYSAGEYKAHRVMWKIFDIIQLRKQIFRTHISIHRGLNLRYCLIDKFSLTVISTRKGFQLDEISKIAIMGDIQ